MTAAATSARQRSKICQRQIPSYIILSKEHKKLTVGLRESWSSSAKSTGKTVCEIQKKKAYAIAEKMTAAKINV